MQRKVIPVEYKFRNFMGDIIDESLSNKKVLRDKYYTCEYLFFHSVYEAPNIREYFSKLYYYIYKK